jgi:hypothetical protein
MIIGYSFIRAIGTYSIGGYYWSLVVIILMVIGGYFIGEY